MTVALLFYGAGAFVLMFLVPLVVFFTRGPDGKPRMEPGVRRMALTLYLAVVAAIVGIGLLVRHTMI